MPTACASRAACAQSPSPSRGLLRGRRGITPALGRGQAQRGQKCPGAPPIFLICKRPALLAQSPTPSGCALPLMPPARSLLRFQAAIRSRAHGARMHAPVRVRELNPIALYLVFFFLPREGSRAKARRSPPFSNGRALGSESLVGLPSAIPRERVALTCVVPATTHGRHRLGSGAAFHGSSSPRCAARALRPASPCQLPPVQPESLARSGLTEKTPEATAPT